jgi:hypothetical protein
MFVCSKPNYGRTDGMEKRDSPVAVPTPSLDIQAPPHTKAWEHYWPHAAEVVDTIHVRVHVESHPQWSGMRPTSKSFVKVTKILLGACTLDTQSLQRFNPLPLVRALHLSTNYMSRRHASVTTAFYRSNATDQIPFTSLGDTPASRGCFPFPRPPQNSLLSFDPPHAPACISLCHRATSSVLSVQL